MKVLTGVMFCLSVAACSLFRTDAGAPSGLDVEYFLVEVDGEPIEAADSEGIFASVFQFSPSPDLIARFIINPTAKLYSDDDQSPGHWYPYGDVSGMYALLPSDGATISWEADGLGDEQVARVEEAKEFMGDLVLLEGDWLYVEIGFVQDSMSMFYPYSESILGYLSDPAICAGQAGPDLAGLLC